MSNSMTNMYNNSPKFKAAIDELDALGIDTRIYFTDNQKEEGSNIEYEIHSYLEDETKSEQKTMHLLQIENDKGIIPDKNGDTLQGAIITIETNSFTTGVYGLDQDHDGIVDDLDNNKMPDAFSQVAFERVIAHEIYHTLEAARGETTLSQRLKTPEEREQSEINARKFEQEVMEEITPSNIVRPHERVDGGNYTNPSDTTPNFIDTVTPESKEVPWEWKDQADAKIQPRPEPPQGVPREWQPSPGATSEADVKNTPYDSISEDGTEYYDGDPILANMGIEDSSYSNDPIEDTPYDSILDDGTEYYDGDPILANIENSSFYSEEPTMSGVENSAFAGNWVEQQSSYDDITPDEPAGPVVSTPDSFSV